MKSTLFSFSCLQRPDKDVKNVLRARRAPMTILVNLLCLGEREEADLLFHWRKYDGHTSMERPNCIPKPDHLAEKAVVSVMRC